MQWFYLYQMGMLLFFNHIEQKYKKRSQDLSSIKNCTYTWMKSVTVTDFVSKLKTFQTPNILSF